MVLALVQQGFEYDGDGDEDGQGDADDLEVHLLHEEGRAAPHGVAVVFTAGGRVFSTLSGRVSGKTR